MTVLPGLVYGSSLQNIQRSAQSHVECPVGSVLVSMLPFQCSYLLRTMTKLGENELHFAEIAFKANL
jgi:hypothetical protein